MFITLENTLVHIGVITNLFSETNFKLLINSLHGATGPYVEAIFKWDDEQSDSVGEDDESDYDQGKVLVIVTKHIFPGTSWAATPPPASRRTCWPTLEAVILILTSHMLLTLSRQSDIQYWVMTIMMMRKMILVFRGKYPNPNITNADNIVQTIWVFEDKKIQ